MGVSRPLARRSPLWLRTKSVVGLFLTLHPHLPFSTPASSDHPPPTPQKARHPSPTPWRQRASLGRRELRVTLTSQIRDRVVIWQICNWKQEDTGGGGGWHCSLRKVSTQGQGARPTDSEPQVRLPQPRPSRGPEASLSQESTYVPFKTFKNVTALVAGQRGVARFVPYEPPWAGPGAGAGQGSDGGVKGYSAHHVGR